MTEHILNFAISLEDDAIREAIYKKAEKEISSSIKKDILNAIFESSDYYNNYTYRNGATITRPNGDVALSDNSRLQGFAINLVKDILNENKEEIIKLAAHELADSFKRTKKWKEAAGKVLEE